MPHIAEPLITTRAQLRSSRALPSARSIATATTVSSLPVGRSHRSTWPMTNLSVMCPNRCQPCLRT